MQRHFHGATRLIGHDCADTGMVISRWGCNGCWRLGSDGLVRAAAKSQTVGAAIGLNERHRERCEVRKPGEGGCTLRPNGVGRRRC